MKTSIIFLASVVLDATVAQATIQYPTGSIVFATFTQVAGTRAEMVNQTEDQLNAAGWTTISGHHSASVIVQSGTTPTALNQVQLNLIDSGAGHCMQIKMRNVLGTQVSQAYFILADVAGTVWQYWANQYTFAIYTPGVSVARQFVMGGTLYIPSFLHGILTGDLGWIQGNSSSDAGAIVLTFRTTPALNVTGGCYQSNLISGAVWNSAGGGSQTGQQSLISSVDSQLANGGTTGGFRWQNGTQFISDAVLVFGLTGPGDEGMARGQIWGAAILSDSWAADTPLTFDTHTWTVLTYANAGVSAQYTRGTLVLATN